MEHFWIYLLVISGWACGGIVGGATGIGSVMIAMPILSMVLSPSDAVLVSCLVAMGASVHLAWSYRHFVIKSDVLPLLIGLLPGSFLGVMVLKVAPVYVLQLMICAMLACFLLMQFFPRLARYSLPSSLPLGVAMGAVCGFVGSSVVMVGAPLSIYVLLNHWDPDRARGNMSLFYLCASTSAVVMQAASGMYSLPLLGLTLAGAVGAMGGQIIGVRLGRHISRKMFHYILLGFLSVITIVLFVRAVS